MKKALILAGIAWDDTWQRHQQIASVLASNGYDVTFIERIPSSVFSVSKVLSKAKQIISSRGKSHIKNDVPDGIKVLRFPFSPPGNPVSDLINKKKVKDKVLPQIGCEFDLVINYLPIRTTEYIYRAIETDNLVYDCVRAFDVWGGYPRSLKQDEKKLLDSADHVLVDSFFLYDKVNKSVDESIITQILPTVKKADYELCKASKKDITEIKSIAYFGSIDGHIDLDALLNLAANGIKINLFGKIYVDDSFLNNQNIKFHGYFNNSAEMFTAILDSSDAVIIPYKTSMDGVIPAKLMQSLATLRPVIISSFYDSDKLNEYMYVYKNHQELIDFVTTFDSTEFNTQKLPFIKTLIEQNFEENLANVILSLNK